MHYLLNVKIKLVDNLKQILMNRMELSVLVEIAGETNACY